MTRRSCLGLGAASAFFAALPAARAAQSGSRAIRVSGVEPVVIKGPTRVAALVLARVRTSAGIEGWGECFPWRAPGNAKELRIPGLIRQLGDSLAGADALQIGAFLERHSSRNTGLEWFAALSAIEIALWDVLGQSAGLPVWQLLGGKVRERIPLYANHGVFASARTSEERLARAIKIKEAGFTMFKWDPFRARGAVSADVIREELKEVALFRESLGPDYLLAIDAHTRYSTESGLLAARELERFRPVFFEEPVPPDALDGYRRIGAESPLPLASGERISTGRQARDILETRSIRYLQMEVGNVGGILPAFQMAAMAAAYDVQIAPHCWCGPIVTRAASQLCAAAPNLFRQEYPSTAAEDAWEKELIDPPNEVRTGELLVAHRPGLGFRVNEKLLSSRRIE